MRYDHRILIGVTAAIGKMGPQSQIITDRVAYQVGRELGNELSLRGLLKEGMGVDAVWKVLNDEVGIDAGARVEKSESGALKVTISSCQICPKKVGKYAIPATACPVGGMVKGVAEAVGLADAETILDLVPGETCVVTIGTQTS